MDWFDIIWGSAAVVIVVIIVVKGYRKTAALQRHGVRTQGVVVRNKVIWGRIIVLRPVIRFTTVTGQVIEAVDHSGWATAIPRFSKGEKVTVIYNEQDPTQFERE